MNFCQASRNILTSPYAKSHMQSNLSNPALWDHDIMQVSESLCCYRMAAGHVLPADPLSGPWAFPQNTPFSIQQKTPTNQQLPRIFKCSQQKPMWEHWIRQQVGGHLSSSRSSLVKPALCWECMKGSSSQETYYCWNNIALWRNGKIILTSLFYLILGDMPSSFRYMAKGSPLE